MKNKSQNAKFFCENCGSEVPQNAKMCKKCGRFFASVRCPKCGETGDANIFKKGCPACGYAMSGKSASFQNKKNKTIFSLSNKFKNTSSYSKEKKSYEDSLPAWMYIFTISLFASLVFVLIRTLR